MNDRPSDAATDQPPCPATYYDEYWSTRDADRTAARSRSRASIAVKLLGESRGTLLEVGCGPGWALEVFVASGFEAQGVDVSAVAVEQARSRDLDVVEGDLEQGPLDGSHDVVVALEVLEHVVDSLGLLRRMVAAVRPGGRVVVSLPNEFSLPRRVGILAGRPGFGGHDDPHVRHFDLRAARRLFAAAGLEVVDRGWDGVVPPRLGFLKSLTDPLASLAPGLLALSGVYLLQKNDSWQ